MTDGPSLSSHMARAQERLTEIEGTASPSIDLTNFALWIEIQPNSTLAGILDLAANELYRRGLFAQGNEIKHVVTELRA